MFENYFSTAPTLTLTYNINLSNNSKRAKKILGTSQNAGPDARQYIKVVFLCVFLSLFKFARKLETQRNKLRCIMNYFRRVTTDTSSVLF